jgi:hypothetical protein
MASNDGATATYSGLGITTLWRNPQAQQQEAAEHRDEPTGADCGHSTDSNGDVVLAGKTGEVGLFGNTEGARVPNFDVTHVQTPVTKRPEPSGLRTNPLTAARTSRGRRGR